MLSACSSCRVGGVGQARLERAWLGRVCGECACGRRLAGLFAIVVVGGLVGGWWLVATRPGVWRWRAWLRFCCDGEVSVGGRFDGLVAFFAGFSMGCTFEELRARESVF